MGASKLRLNHLSFSLQQHFESRVVTLFIHPVERRSTKYTSLSEASCPLDAHRGRQGALKIGFQHPGRREDVVYLHKTKKDSKCIDGLNVFT